MSRETQSDQSEWLTLSEAANRLNVHPTTLRRWADEGQIPYMLTPGGHRRFAASDVGHLAERRHSVRRFGPVERIWADHALEKTRKALMASSEGGWIDRFDEKTRNEHRAMGHKLMMVTLRFLTEETESEGLIEEARAIGREYGENGRSLGMALTDVLMASMFFRDTLLAAAVELPENVRIPAASQVQLLNRINRVLNTVQLGVADVYDG